jgi:hypothetical protein
VQFQLRAEVSNLFNHPSAGNPSSTITSGYTPGNSSGDAALGFGTVTSTSLFYNPRYIQLAGKIVF